ncbi:unnamed protein product [Hymenolepis diminuta]|uniref:Uncharacterized protein n=1 Tax=Hymenolepis diminuta TaxID=6216 RepID=A0A564YSF8_HYMDI|nr:unnamed protein product [Hymenolepis diminuta]
MDRRERFKSRSKLGKSNQLNRIRWMNLALYHTLQLAIKSKSVKRLQSSLKAYNRITKFCIKFSADSVCDGSYFKFLICGAEDTLKIAARVHKSIDDIYSRDNNLSVYVRMYFDAAEHFTDIIKQPEFIRDPDVFIFVSNLPKSFRGWIRERRFFREAVQYFEENRMPNCVFVVDARQDGTFLRLIQLFRLFVPHRARNFQPCFQNETHLKLWQLKWRSDRFSNLLEVLTEAYFICHFRKTNANDSPYRASIEP